jgi:hypothetical protein
MFITENPGPWQYYVNRPDNVGLPLMEIKDKYMREQLLFEQYQYNQYINYQNWLSSQGGGMLPTTGSIDNTINSFVETNYVEDYFL